MVGEFQSADDSLTAGGIGQISLSRLKQGLTAQSKAACSKLAWRSARIVLARRTRWWPLAWIALAAIFVVACSAPPSHPAASSSSAGNPSRSASGEPARSASARSSTSASPSPSSSGKVKPTPQRSSSSAAASGLVPNLAGETLAQGRSALFTAGFHAYSWLYGCYGSPNLNEVVQQDPAAGARAAFSTRVHMGLQADNCPTPVPNVIGMDQASAVSTGEQAGFRVHWEYKCLGSSDIGAVITQSPIAGTSYPRGDTVDIYLQANNCSSTAPPV
jgi:beta-lactam-binding protein with PASTA domain